MKLSFSPQVSGRLLAVVKLGDALKINGDLFDFAMLPEGASLPSSAVNCDFIVDDVRRVDGHVNITLLLPIAWDATHDACFPSPIINPPDGVIRLPGGGNAN